MSFSNRKALLLPLALALAASQAGCSTAASMVARATAAERERRAAASAYPHRHEDGAYAGNGRPADTMSGGTPDWAIHIERPEIQASATLEALEPRLLDELRKERSADLSVSPEQLGALAVRELQQGHFLDAAVLLALASHRRVQQAHVVQGHGGPDGLALARKQVGHGNRLNGDMYQRFVEHEAKTFREARFDDAIDRIAAHRGAPLDDKAVHEDMQRLVMGNINDGYAASRALKERAAVLVTPAPEKLFHPRLAAALHDYLLLQGGFSSLEQREQAAIAGSYLARVPLKAFRYSALQTVARPFDGLIIRAGLHLYEEEGKRVAKLLRSVRGETRAHVAIILGLSGDITRIQEINDAWGVERDPRVRLAMEFALLRLGEMQHMAALEAALRDQNPIIVEYGIVLVHWLPYDLEVEFSQESFARHVANRSLATGARLLAVQVLCELSGKRPLAEASIGAALAFARELKDKPEQLELVSRSLATLEQLDRGRVLEAIRNNQSPLDPWLARWAKVAIPADLKRLDALIRSRMPRERQMLIVQVAAAIPGSQAQTALQRWFSDFTALRTAIAVQLLLRDDLDKERLRIPMTAVGGAHKLMFALARGEANPKQAAPYLKSRDPDERYTSILALKLFGNTLYRQLIWPSAGYQDDRTYPSEIRLRQLALSALIDLELNRSDVHAVGEPAADGLALQEITDDISGRVDRLRLPSRLPDPPSDLRLRPTSPAELNDLARSARRFRSIEEQRTPQLETSRGEESVLDEKRETNDE